MNEKTTRVEKNEALEEAEKDDTPFQLKNMVSGEPEKIIRSREWCLTIPRAYYSKDYVMEKLKPYTWAGQLEKGEESTEKNEQGYYHFQIGIFANEAVRNTTIYKMFPKAHREKRKHSKKALYEYVVKSKTRVDGPWFNGPWETSKDMILRATKNQDLQDIQDALFDGATPQEIYRDRFLGMKAVHYSNWIEKTYSALVFDEKAMKQDRDLTVEYVWGEPGSGKTKYALSGDRNSLYVATLTSDAHKSSWSHAFDAYAGQKTLVLDDFYYWAIPLEYLLHLLDRYPLQLDARYENKWACWTRVVITSNFNLEQQYPGITNVQRKSLERRITKVTHMSDEYTKERNDNDSEEFESFDIF